MISAGEHCHEPVAIGKLREMYELGRWLRQHGQKHVPAHLRAACKALLKQA